MEEKRELNVPAVILPLFILGVFVFVSVSSFVYFSLNGPDYTLGYKEKMETGEIKNPVQEFSLVFSDSSGEETNEGNVIRVDTEEGEKIIIINSDITGMDFSEIQKKMVQYTAVILKVYNLHEISFISITPKIQILY